jgi:uncharacterized sporulation protein YeaH/YhbH (DUF444 family)
MKKNMKPPQTKKKVSQLKFEPDIKNKNQKRFGFRKISDPKFIKFETFTAPNIHIVVFCITTPCCSHVDGSQNFGTKYF